ncbi:hypothetical protein VSQ48_20130 [Candidatus Ventrimonas sp. KK005]
MLREEFEQRTGFFPTLEEYKIIERYYLDFSGDKDIFCKAYKKNEEWLAEKIQKEADMQAIKERLRMEHVIEEYEAKIARLNADLEREQEWRPYVDTDLVSEEDYQELARCHNTRGLSDEEAKQLLYDWYGFARDKIRILHSVPRYERNRHNRLREIGKLERQPLYNATDWNYIRFDCGCMSYELYNDSLRVI